MTTFHGSLAQTMGNAVGLSRIRPALGSGKKGNGTFVPRPLADSPFLNRPPLLTMLDVRMDMIGHLNSRTSCYCYSGRPKTRVWEL